MPGGETCSHASVRPIDLGHLSRQTFGDRDLEREVLKLFLQQTDSVQSRIAQANAKERHFLAHGLKGSARGIGAFAIADCAGEIEDRPDDMSLIKKLGRLIGEAHDFIAAINR